ncbi:MAG: branched-chain amino acid ABC transporter permease, partial [Pseudomonadota bacterium]|nr:branched-chain amino acid ABC transporter permease [Pseudomonadota bacterium]
MLAVILSGLAMGALYAATALAYNVMFSTSKVLSVTTGHIAMLGGVFGAWFMTRWGWTVWL